MSGYISSVLLGILLCASTIVSAQGDAADSSKSRRPRNLQHQLRFGLDLRGPIENLLLRQRVSYEASIDYLLNDNDVYAVIEGGSGHSSFKNSVLSYSSGNYFLRAGADKSMLKRLRTGDWDAAVIGARYGIGFINRKEAEYAIRDTLWGNVSGTTPGRSFTGHWAEVIMGIRLEVFPRCFAGWNVRAKFLLNPKTFAELSPYYISGYGRGDRSTAFDFNLYIMYALRWGGRGPQ